MNTIKTCMEFNKDQEELGKIENEHPTECPFCAWTLQTNSKGQVSCPMCQRIWK